MGIKFTKRKIEDLLIDCMHSDSEAEEFFLKSLDNMELLKLLIRIVDKSDSEDAQICAAYWISKFNLTLLSSVETKLLEFQKIDYIAISGPIMYALGRIHSQEGLRYLLDEVLGNKISWEVKALKEYIKNRNDEKKSY